MNTTATLVICAGVGAASAQSDGVASIGIDAPASYTSGEVIDVVVTLDSLVDPAGGLPYLGIGGWAFALDVTGGSVVSATYLTPLDPRVDLFDPFTGDAGPEVSASGVVFAESANAFAPLSAVHGSGALAVVSIDTATVNGGPIELTTRVLSDTGGLGSAVAWARASTTFSGFELIGYQEVEFGSAVIVPGPSGAAVIATSGLMMMRRRR